MTYPIDNNFCSHMLDSAQAEDAERIRGAAYIFAYAILQTVPDSRERSLALTKVEEAMFWANAGIARACPPAES